jgi:hypothetical protein
MSWRTPSEAKGAGFGAWGFLLGFQWGRRCSGREEAKLQELKDELEDAK